MESENLNSKLLDTALSAISRTRTLLFTINLIAGLVFLLLYLDTNSFDNKQRRDFLLAYKTSCDMINSRLELTAVKLEFSDADKKIIKECSDLSKIRGILLTNNIDESLLQEISRLLFRLHRIQNELNAVKLESISLSSLGFGLSIPRNDTYVICGWLLIILYLWLLFSLTQNTRVVSKIKLLYPENTFSKNEVVRATISDLIELNFIFRSKKGIKLSFLVNFLYLFAPIVFTLSTFDVFFYYRVFSVLDLSFLFFSAPLYITLFLWIVVYKILKLNRDTDADRINLINLHGLKLGMSKRKVAGMTSISIKENLIKLTEKDLVKLKNFNDLQKLSLTFNKNKLALVDIIYTDEIQWNSSKELAKKLSEIFELPFYLWEFSLPSGEAKLEFESFLLKIDSTVNQIILSNRNIDEMESKKQNFKF